MVVGSEIGSPSGSLWGMRRREGKEGHGRKETKEPKGSKKINKARKEERKERQQGKGTCGPTSGQGSGTRLAKG